MLFLSDAAAPPWKNLSPFFSQLGTQKSPFFSNVSVHTYAHTDSDRIVIKDANQTIEWAVQGYMGTLNKSLKVSFCIIQVPSPAELLLVQKKISMTIIPNSFIEQKVNKVKKKFHIKSYSDAKTVVCRKTAIMVTTIILIYTVL